MENENIVDDVLYIIAEYFNVNECFLDLQVEDGIEFIKQKFLALNKDENRVIIVHQVCAIEPEQFRAVMWDVHHSLLRCNMYSR
eukprot:CAMPEP_0197023654 /NCGR_PEP_ID=MMETSP1384-20130603/4322_1 /TAXON_ID=29189 /ORGANISM="Ammonia sp." /LENGTH=83 /DNA_ID=CAMNT_0042451899 /DNA_START=75 /DNA_END=322 /DNA_ORIENTATION=-